MLPTPLISFYRQYKLDTDSVASWLASTARARGYPSGLLANSGTVKGRSKKKGNDGKTSQSMYIVALKDFIPLAQFIVSSKKPTVIVPESFVKTLDRVITIRASFGAKMAEYGAEQSAQSDQSHNYFVGILEEVRNILRPRMSKKTKKLKPAALSTLDEALASRFKVLEVYEPSEAFLGAADIERPPTTPSPENISYQAEMPAKPNIQDAIMYFDMLIDDLRKIRDQIRSIWSKFHKREIELSGAAVATDTAINFARNLSEEVLPHLESHGGFWGVARKFISAAAAVEQFSAENFGVIYDLASDPGTELNGETYEVANRLYFNAYLGLDRFRRRLHDTSDESSPPGPAEPRSRRNADNEGKSRWMIDQIIMNKALLDRLTIVNNIPGWPVQDEFLRGLKDLCTTGKIPFYLVFAAQIHLDIHHILKGHVCEGFAEMKYFLGLMQHDLSAHLKLHENVSPKNRCFRTKGTIAVIVSRLKWIIEDPIHQMRFRLAEDLEEEAARALTSREQHSLLQGSPIMAGLLLFQCRNYMYQAGRLNAEDCSAITGSAHLYNALRLEGLLEGPWPDMEVLFRIFGKSSFFVGDGPQERGDYLKALFRQLGVSVKTFFKRNRDQPLVKSAAGRRRIKVARVSDLVAKRYSRNGESTDWTVDEVRTIVGCSSLTKGTTQNIRILEEGLSEDFEELASGARFSPERLIDCLTIALENEHFEFTFPLFLFHRWCWAMLQSVEKPNAVLLRNIYPQGYLPVDGEAHYIVNWIFTAMNIPGFNHGRMMDNAAEAMKGFIAKGGDLVVRTLETKHGFDIDI